MLKMNGMDKFVVIWVNDHPVSLNMFGRAKQINDQNSRFAMYVIFLLVGL